MRRSMLLFSSVTSFSRTERRASFCSLIMKLKASIAMSKLSQRPPSPSRFEMRVITSLTSTALPGACCRSSFFFSRQRALLAWSSSLAFPISDQSCCACVISSMVVGRVESFSIDSVKKVSTSLNSSSTVRRRAMSSVSLRRCIWSSRVDLNGASETRMQSIRSKSGSFSASFRFALSMRKFASYCTASVTCSSTNASRSSIVPRIAAGRYFSSTAARRVKSSSALR
mmetsp:Transcript_98919/g.282914  ORF Transcript_98919/g.282914 Transcript_98919/m.282914 type:complete len:227 (+) Transcript_98919:2079-2759(+)